MIGVIHSNVWTRVWKVYSIDAPFFSKTNSVCIDYRLLVTQQEVIKPSVFIFQILGDSVLVQTWFIKCRARQCGHVVAGKRYFIISCCRFDSSVRAKKANDHSRWLYFVDAYSHIWGKFFILAHWLPIWKLLLCKKEFLKFSLRVKWYADNSWLKKNLKVSALVRKWYNFHYSGFSKKTPQL